MRRRLEALTETEFDLVVVGGGIFGACAAWDAAQRGLSVALVERADFGGATSANSFKMIHGGIRYIQHGDIARVRASSNERRAFLRIAPHLVRPLRIVVPTYGHGMKGRAVLGIGVGLYDTLTWDRNRGLRDPARRVARSRTLSRSQVLEAFPDLASPKLTGAAVICEGQMYNPPRLVLSFVRSAVEAGAVAANYVEAVGLLRAGDRATGLRVRDVLGGAEFALRARVVLNAAGPFANLLLDRDLRERSVALPFSRDACFVVRRRLTPPDVGLAVQGSTRDPDAIVGRGERHLFIVPWREYSLVGVWHKVYRDHPDRVSVSEEELAGFIAEINGACPWLGLQRQEVGMVNAGLVPFGQNPSGASDLRYGHRSTLIDHAATRSHRLEGLVSLIGVRFTTGRREAARAVDLVFRKLGHKPPACRTAETPIWGGNVDDLETATRDVRRKLRDDIDEDAVRGLVSNHGSALSEVMECSREEPRLSATLDGTNVLGGEVVHAVRQEMAQKLADVVFRRTDLGSAGLPGDGSVASAGRLMAAECGWDREHLAREIDEVRRSSLVVPASRAERSRAEVLEGVKP